MNVGAANMEVIKLGNVDSKSTVVLREDNLGL
jgi:hypothetical protein